MQWGFQAISVGIGVVILSVVAVVLGGSTILGSAVLGSFSGYTAIAVLVPLVILAKMLYEVWQGRGNN